MEGLAPPLMQTEKDPSPFQSKKDPTRENVGKIYSDAQKTKERVEVGDMKREMMKSLVDDLNECLKSNPFQDRPFYCNVYEKKDLQMKNAILRRLYVTVYRPWPEDDTMVFWMNPKSSEVRFCWCLPHWAEMDNILNNAMLYDNELVSKIVSWKYMNYAPFGFVKDALGNWISNPNWIDKKLD